jgi:hypothetical protein
MGELRQEIPREAGERTDTTPSGSLTRLQEIDTEMGIHRDTF